MGITSFAGRFEPDSQPWPTDSVERQRWEEEQRRWCMQTGAWSPYVRLRMEEFFTEEENENLEEALDLSKNPFKLSNEKKAVIYDNTPAVSAGGKSLDAIRPEVLWPLRQTGHTMTNACNESLMRLDWDLEYEQIGYRVVEPYRIIAESTNNRPTEPNYIEELRKRGNDWTWEIWDVRRPGAPSFRITSPDGKQDWTERYIPGLGGRYPLYDESNVPILPYIQYHVEIGTTLWSPWPRIEIVEGTLTAACIAAWWLANLRDASYVVNAAVGLRIPSSEPGAGMVDRIPISPRSLLIFEQMAQGGGLQALQRSTNPVEFHEAMDLYIAWLLECDGLGIEPQNTSRMSGYAIQVTRDSLRRVQSKQTPACRAGDQLLLATAARITNRHGTGPKLPEKPKDWQITYHGVELSLEEKRSRLEALQILRKAEGGPFISRVDGMMHINPQLTPEQAQQKLDEIAAEGGAFNADAVRALAEADAAASQGDAAGALAAIRRAAAAMGITPPKDDGPDTLTDPSDGSPLRTPRGVST